MNLTEQVVSLELALKLKNLGVKQESYFYWYQYCDQWLCEPKGQLPTFAMPIDERIISAFTVSELGEILIPIIEEFEFSYYPDKTSFYHLETYKLSQDFSDTTEANCRAKMLIYIIEIGLYKPEDKA